jgi:formylglycine-generating enzyme
MPPSLRRLAVALAVPVVVLASCQDPTQITVSLQTNVPFESGKTAFALWTSTGGSIAAGTPPQLTYAETWTENVPVGEIAVTPSGDKSSPLLVRVVLGLGGKNPAECLQATQKGCIVATRRLAFVRHTPLRVPVVLHLACEGVPCSSDETCNYLGKCVSASVNPADCARADSEAGSPDVGPDGADTGVGEAGDAADGGTDATDAADAADAADSGPPSSCAAVGDGLSNCRDVESCCASLPVTGGTFSRSYDGASTICAPPPDLTSCTDPQYAATVADFRLDKYEVTVGRFRRFVAAAAAGWRPAPGSGKHAHLNGGSGLATSGGGFEQGWSSAWSALLPSTKGAWDAGLACQTTPTWTADPQTNERRPITCVSWYEAAAFCIWDGGFLASEAEWNFAAAGGAEQRVYPWSTPPTSTTLDDAHTVFCGASCASAADVGSKVLGDGKFGQADLAGNAWEWVSDSHVDPYAETSCVNCTNHTLATDPRRVLRGGSFAYDPVGLLTGWRFYVHPGARNASAGVRCARLP